MTRRYAQDTSVSVEKSRAEIEGLLSKYGATSFMSGASATEAVIAFEMADRKVMFRLPLPSKAERRFTHTPGKHQLRHPQDQQREWEQACRSRWRALALAIKAKLEAVAIGITTFDREFYAHIMLPGGMNVYEATKDNVELAYQTGQVQPLLPDYSKGSR